MKKQHWEDYEDFQDDEGARGGFIKSKIRIYISALEIEPALISVWNIAIEQFHINQTFRF